MAYKLENFLIQVSETDRLLKIKDSSNLIKHTIDGYSITSLRAVNNIVKIITKSNTIDLDFSTTNEARIALSRIQAQIDLLKEKSPLFIDKKISNYVSSVTGPQGYMGYQGYTGPQGFADKYSATSSTPLQVPAIGDIVLLYTQTELAYTAGQSVLAYNTLVDNFFNEDYVYEPTVSFQGQVDGYDKSSGLLSLLIDNSSGYGLTDSFNEIATYSFWYLNLIGQFGPQGFADKYSATSSTALQVPDSGYVANLVTQKNLAYTPGQSVLVYNTLLQNYMVDDYVEGDLAVSFIGYIDDYIPETGDLQIVVDSSIGHGLTNSSNQVFTYSFWYVNLTGQSVSGSGGSASQGATGNAGPQGDFGPQGDLGPQGSQGPSNGGSSGARFINTLLVNSPGSTDPVIYSIFLPWPYDSFRGMSMLDETGTPVSPNSQGKYIQIDSSDSVKYYNVTVSFQIYNAANELYGYDARYNTGNGTYSLFSTSINGATDANKRQTYSNIYRVPAGVTASFYFTRYTTTVDEEAMVGNFNIIEIL